MTEPTISNVEVPTAIEQKIRELILQEIKESEINMGKVYFQASDGEKFKLGEVFQHVCETAINDMEERMLLLIKQLVKKGVLDEEKAAEAIVAYTEEVQKIEEEEDDETEDRVTNQEQ